MITKAWSGRATSAVILIFVIWLTSVPVAAQDLVAVTSLTGGSSVFVFRSAARTAIRRVASVTKPVRSKAQRIDSAAKIKKQYETQAKVTPQANRATAVDPANKPPKVLTGPEASKRFAGIGEYYLSKGDFDQAFDSFRDAMRLDDTNETAKAGYSEGLALKGNDLLIKDQAATAKGLFLEAIKFSPKNSAAYFGLGEVYAALDQRAEAIANYETSLENNKNLTEIYVPLGILYYQTGEIAKADDLLSKALLIKADNAETQFFLGLIRASQNRNDEALAAFAKAKILDPANSEVYHNTGEVLTRLKRPADAIAEYQKATSLKPTYFDAWLGLGDAYAATSNYAEALKAYSSASKLKNDSWEALAGLAEAYRQTGKFEDAEAKFNLAALFLGRVKDYNKDTLSELYSKTGVSISQQCDINTARNVVCNWPGAIKAFQKSVDISNDPIDYVNLGTAYFRFGHSDIINKDPISARPKLDSAKSWLEKAIAAGPPAADFASGNLASVEIDLGDYNGAIDLLKKILAKHPEVVYTKYQLGAAYKMANDLANAEKWLSEAADGDPKNLGYLVGLADTLISRKKGKELKKVIDRIRPLDAAVAADLESRGKLLRLF